MWEWVKNRDEEKFFQDIVGKGIKWQLHVQALFLVISIFSFSTSVFYMVAGTVIGL